MSDLIHPDDVLLFEEVSAAMRRVAKRYGLPLSSVTPYPRPDYRTAPLGDCAASGDVRLTLRGMAGGQWDDEPRREDDVWDTAAHELAHLRHHNHGVAFQEFEEEMREAVRNQRADHREKIISKIVKLQAQRDSEAKLGNTAAAESFAAAVNRLLLDYELSPTDVDYARAASDDPVIEVPFDRAKYGVPEKQRRIAWQESLAKVVANAHLCRFLIRQGSNEVWFVGTRAHAAVAEYVYGTLVPAAERMADEEYVAYFYGLRRAGKDVRLARGFRPAWLSSFVGRVEERLSEERRAAAAKWAPADTPGTTSTALLRLDQAIVKVQKYMDDRFQMKRKYASALNGGARDHADGRAWGRAAADRVPIGRRAVEGPKKPRGLLG